MQNTKAMIANISQRSSDPSLNLQKFVSLAKRPAYSLVGNKKKRILGEELRGDAKFTQIISVCTEIKEMQDNCITLSCIPFCARSKANNCADTRILNRTVTGWGKNGNGLVYASPTRPRH